ncbi:MAG: hypothetical protein ABIP94_17540 [Planctomycetota bacterium]
MGISRAGIEAFIQKLIAMPMDSLSSPQIQVYLDAFLPDRQDRVG